MRRRNFLRNLRGLSILLALLSVIPQQIVQGITEDFEIKGKKYVRTPVEPPDPPQTRPRRVRPAKEQAQSKPTAPPEREPLKPFIGPIATPPQDLSKGPEIRIALSTDTGIASISSSRPITQLSGDDTVQLAAKDLKVQIDGGSVRERPNTYRVQVASLKSGNDADSLAGKLRRRFAEPVRVDFDSKSGAYEVTVGEFSSQRDAQALMVRVMNAGYKKTWVAKDARDDFTKARLRVLSADGERLALAKERLALLSEDDEIAPLRYNGSYYRGRLEIFVNKRGRLSVINTLTMEDYVRGVVPNELSPSGFPMLEALKAQAVAARTYAMHNLGQFEKEGFDLLPTALSQVYGGKSSEHPLTDRAVSETAGMVATYNGQPINALYTSTCGGRTESSEFVFSEAVPYLVSVACYPQQRNRRNSSNERKDGDQNRKSKEPEVDFDRGVLFKSKPESEAKPDRKRNSDDDDEARLGPNDLLAPRILKTSRRPEPILIEGGRAVTREIASLYIMGFALPDAPTPSYFLETASQKDAMRWVVRAAEAAGRPIPLSVKDPTSVAGFSMFLAKSLYGEDRSSALLSPADAEYILGDDADDIPQSARAEVAGLLQDGILSPGPNGSLRPRDPMTRGAMLLAIARALAKMGRPALDGGTSRPFEGRSIKIRPAKNREPLELEIAKDCWLFRFVNNEAYPAGSVKIIGGEKVSYHLDSKGRIDYLEVQPNPNGAASDRYSVYSRWLARMTAGEVRTKLAEARVSVGEIIDLQSVKYGQSRRVAELKVIGAEGERSISGLRIRSALGLRENLFIIQREYDARGQVNAFRFVGRGWGHGVGMCQVGAYGLAVEGLDYQDILKTYYSNIDLTKYY